MASVKAHKADKRVLFFARVCGIVDPLPEETMEYYMAVLSNMMMDRLRAGSEGERLWIVTMDGRTWIPRLAANAVSARLVYSRACTAAAAAAANPTTDQV